MRTSLLRGHVLLLIVLFASPLKADTHFTTDPVSGLDWLSLSETANMAYADAQASFPDWRYATNAEIEALFSTWFPAFVSDGLTGSADSFWSPYAGINEEAKAFVEAFGPTYDADGWLWAVGVYRDENDTLRPLGALIRPDYSASQVLGPEYVNLPILATDVNPRYGVYLVRGTVATPDVTPPFLTTVMIDPEIISTAGGDVDVTVEVSATDSESGVARFALFFDDPGSDADGVGITLERALDPAEPVSTANFTAVFPAAANEGLWQISGEVQDAAGNVTVINGGENGIPNGVLVDNSQCDASTVEPRLGKYTRLSFGQAIDVNSSYLHVIAASEIRSMQREMHDYAGWDAELRSIDYAIYKSHCEMQSLKKWLKKGTYYVDQYNFHKETVEELINTDLYIKIETLKRYVATIQEELSLSHFQELQDLIIRADRRDYIRDNPGFVEEGLAVWGDWNTMKSFLEFTSGVAKVTRVSIFATLVDIHNIIQDSKTIYEILFEENATFDQYGDSFQELIIMNLEMSLLIEQYEEQRKEYRRLIR